MMTAAVFGRTWDAVTTASLRHGVNEGRVFWLKHSSGITARVELVRTAGSASSLLRKYRHFSVFRAKWSNLRQKGRPTLRLWTGKHHSPTISRCELHMLSVCDVCLWTLHVTVRLFSVTALSHWILRSCREDMCSCSELCIQTTSAKNLRWVWGTF